MNSKYFVVYNIHGNVKVRFFELCTQRDRWVLGELYKYQNCSDHEILFSGWGCIDDLSSLNVTFDDHDA